MTTDVIPRSADMRWPTRHDLRNLAGSHARPCLSLYVPFRTAFAEHIGNAKRYGQAVVRAADGLQRSGLSLACATRWAKRLTELELRRSERPQHGIGVFLDAREVRVFRFATPPSERVVVADCFSLRELARQVELIWPEPSPLELSTRPRLDKLALELDRILAAAHRGTIRSLWTRQGAAISGRIDAATGRIVSADGGDGDVLDALAASVLHSGGRVFVVPGRDIPGGVSAAAEIA
jgi:hypothetical protein